MRNITPEFPGCTHLDSLITIPVSTSHLNEEEIKWWFDKIKSLGIEVDYFGIKEDGAVFETIKES